MVYNRRKHSRQIAGNQRYSVNCLTGEEEKPSTAGYNEAKPSGCDNGIGRAAGGEVAAHQQSTPGAGKGMGMVTPKDMALLEKVVAEVKRWEIPAECRRTLPESMARIACDESNNIRDRVAAARVLAQLDALNLSEEKHANPQIRVNVNLTDEAKSAKLQAILGSAKLLPAPNQTDSPATPAE